MKAFNSPDDAQSRFYQAIEAGDAEAMMQVWSNDQSLVCIHPGAPPLDDRELIAESWMHILADTDQLRFRVCSLSRFEAGPLAILNLRVSIELDGEQIDQLLTTNVFHLGEQGWHMVVHHASPDPDFNDEDEAELDTLIEPDGPVVLH